MDLISVIVPVYNVEKYLVRCIESILKQTYKELEIILVDDGSTDKSGKICDSYGNQDDRIIVIHKINAGLGMARNSGLDIATGTYVMFIDSDDYVEPDYVSNLVSDLIKNIADTCIGGFQKECKNTRKILGNPLAEKKFKDKDVRSQVLARMFGYSNTDISIEMSVWKTVYSMSIIRENNIKFPSEREFISEDIIFDTEYFSKASCVYISRYNGYIYCDNEGSLTNKYQEDRFEKNVILYNELYMRADTIGIGSLVKDRLDNSLIAIARYSIKLEQKFARNNGFIAAIKNIRAICNNPTLKILLATYNESNLKRSSMIVNSMIRHKMIFPLYLTMCLKNTFNI